MGIKIEKAWRVYLSFWMVGMAACVAGVLITPGDSLRSNAEFFTVIAGLFLMGALAFVIEKEEV